MTKRCSFCRWAVVKKDPMTWKCAVCGTVLSDSEPKKYAQTVVGDYRWQKIGKKYYLRADSTFTSRTLLVRQKTPKIRHTGRLG